MNASTNNQDRQRGGSALVAVMGVILLIVMVAISMVALGRQQIFSSVHLRDYVKAKMIAEAGANDAYNVLKTNFDARSNPSNFPPTSFDSGIYDAEVASVGSNRAFIICTGTYGSAVATVKLDIKNYRTTTTNSAPIPGVAPFGFAVLCGGDVIWAGNSDSQLSNGWVHGNGAYSANGINILRGNVQSCDFISLVGGATITGQGCAPTISGGVVGTPVTGPVALVRIPDIDLTPYYNAALANGQVFASGKTISGTLTPPGGIMWVNGTLYIGNGNFTGCFIATGAIELQTTGNNTITINKTARYPILVSRDSSITIKQVKTFNFHGLIYCKTGSFDKQGNGDVYGIGSIIAAGNVSKNGGWSGMIYEDSTPVAPGGTDTASRDKVLVKAWQD